jgi:hypothetical protein
VPGNTGPAGADGAQGPQGNTGPQGDPGIQGPQGPAGAGYVSKVTSNVTNSTTTPANITGLAFPVTASTEYAFEAVVTHQGTSTSGPRFNLNGPAGATLVNIRWQRCTSPTAQTQSSDTAFSAAAQTAAITSSGNTTAMTSVVYGVIVNGANAGTAQFMLTSSTAGQTVTVYRGSAVHTR